MLICPIARRDARDYSLDVGQAIVAAPGGHVESRHGHGRILYTARHAGQSVDIRTSTATPSAPWISPEVAPRRPACVQGPRYALPVASQVEQPSTQHAARKMRALTVRAPVA